MIGKGMFGNVFLAKHLRSEKYYAIKYVSKTVIFEKKLVDELQKVRTLSDLL